MNTDHRQSFVPSEGIYLLSHSVGRPLVNTREVWSEAFLRPWENAGEQVWPQWLQAIDDFRGALAELLGGDVPDFCPQVNLSSALTKVLPALPLSEGKSTILYTEHDFPSMGFVLQQARHSGFRLKLMARGSDCLDPQQWADAITGDVGVVLISHVHSNYGRQVPVADICRMARERGVISIVDVAQSVGVVPIDLRRWYADVVLGSCVKWLCGGPGAGFLWITPDLQSRSRPRDVGWFSHEDPFEFDIHNFRYAADALRFWGGTPSVQPYAVAANSIRHLHGIGIGTIRAHNLKLNNRLIDAIDPAALVTPTAGEQRGGTLVFQLPAARHRQLVERLAQAGVAFDSRPSGIRLSPHIYNTAQEIEVVVEQLCG